MTPKPVLVACLAGAALAWPMEAELILERMELPPAVVERYTPQDAGAPLQPFSWHQGNLANYWGALYCTSPDSSEMTTLVAISNPFNAPAAYDLRVSDGTGMQSFMTSATVPPFGVTTFNLRDLLDEGIPRVGFVTVGSDAWLGVDELTVDPRLTSVAGTRFALVDSQVGKSQLDLSVSADFRVFHTSALSTELWTVNSAPQGIDADDPLTFVALFWRENGAFVGGVQVMTDQSYEKIPFDKMADVFDNGELAPFFGRGVIIGNSQEAAAIFQIQPPAEDNRVTGWTHRTLQGNSDDGGGASWTMPFHGLRTIP